MLRWRRSWVVLLFQTLAAADIENSHGEEQHGRGDKNDVEHLLSPVLPTSRALAGKWLTRGGLRSGGHDKCGARFPRASAMDAPRDSPQRPFRSRVWHTGS